MNKMAGFRLTDSERRGLRRVNGAWTGEERVQRQALARLGTPPKNDPWKHYNAVNEAILREKCRFYI